MASDSPSCRLRGGDAAALRAYAPRSAGKRQNGIYRKNDTQLQVQMTLEMVLVYVRDTIGPLITAFSLLMNTEKFSFLLS
jgi:hypothetical protein